VKTKVAKKTMMSNGGNGCRDCFDSRSQHATSKLRRVIAAWGFSSKDTFAPRHGISEASSGRGTCDLSPSGRDRHWVGRLMTESAMTWGFGRDGRRYEA
jgi:hypothetical protein